jgi:hypothetical protein
MFEAGGRKSPFRQKSPPEGGRPDSPPFRECFDMFLLLDVSVPLPYLSTDLMDPNL